MSDIETRLRATLLERAEQAPPGGPLAERILDEVHAPARVLRPRHGWRTWTLPLLAAGAVAAIVGAIVGIEHAGTTASPQQSVVPPATRPATTTATPSVSATSEIKAQLLAPAPAARTIHAPRPTAIGVNDFMALSTTFVSVDEGWVLGASQCLDPSGAKNADGTCPAMLHTTDGGKSWQLVANPPGNTPGLGCATPCIQSIRFANSEVGYAFSPSTLEMTVNGGKTWATAAGGATALETLDGNVIRVEQVAGCQQALCHERVLTAPVGSTQWTPITTLPALVNEVGMDQQAELSRVGHRAVLLTWANVGRNGEPAHRSSAVYTSGDDGKTWSAPGDPCSTDGSMSASAVDLAPDATLHVLCSDLAESNPRNVVMTSTDAGSHYAVSPRLPFDPDNGWLSSASARTLFVPVGNGLDRSTDGGRTWRLVIKDKAGQVGAAGFEDGTVGRYLSRAGRTIWTTHDAGKTWQPFDFS